MNEPLLHAYRAADISQAMPWWIATLIGFVFIGIGFASAWAVKQQKIGLPGWVAPAFIVLGVVVVVFSGGSS